MAECHGYRSMLFLTHLWPFAILFVRRIRDFDHLIYSALKVALLLASFAT